MIEPFWLEKSLVLAVQDELIAIHGGLGGVREDSLLESALARPQQLFAYGQPDIYQLGAAYAQGIVKNHPFLDGNKRAGFMAAFLFLKINSYHLVVPEVEVVTQTLALAAGEIGAEEYALWLKASSVSDA